VAKARTPKAELHRDIAAEGPVKSESTQVLVASENDLPFLPTVSGWSGKVFTFESLREAYAVHFVPRLALLLPIKRTPLSGRDIVEESASYVLRDWLRRGTDIVMVLPARRSSDVVDDHESQLRRAVLELVRVLERSADFVEEPTPVPPREFSMIRRSKTIRLRSALVQFGLSIRPPSAPFSSTGLSRRQAALGRRKDAGQGLFPANVEVLAVNEFGHAVSLSSSAELGRIILVPRGMLTAELAVCNDLIPQIEVLQFPSSAYSEINRLQQVDAKLNEEELGDGLRLFSSDEAATRTASSARSTRRKRGMSKTAWGHQRLGVLLNGRQVTVTARGWLLLERLWRAESDRITRRQENLVLEWPDPLSSKANRKQVVFRLRKTFDRLGAEVLCEPNPGETVRLAPRARAGLFAAAQGYEVPPTWPPLTITPEPKVKPLRRKVKPPPSPK
jgi:hypothetical protein